MMPSAQTEPTPPSIVSDCWNRIGIRGDLSCPELKRQTHCRNCPTYALAALALLDRALPPDYRAEQSVHLGRHAAIEAVDRRAAFIFRIATEWFALPVPLLVEVASPRVIHSLPHRRSGIVMGLVDVRGELLICVSLLKLLGLDDTSAPDGAGSDATYPRLVVIRHGGWRTVFPVSEVGGIHRYHEQELKEVPVTVAKGASSYTNAILPWAGKSVGSLDEQSLIETLNQSFA
jgi:chemotaxis-related protein WspD